MVLEKELIYIESYPGTRWIYMLVTKIPFPLEWYKKSTNKSYKDALLKKKFTLSHEIFVLILSFSSRDATIWTMLYPYMYDLTGYSRDGISSCAVCGLLEEYWLLDKRGCNYVVTSIDSFRTKNVCSRECEDLYYWYGF